MMTEVVNVEAAPNNNAAPTANKSGAGDNRPLAWLRINLDYFRTPPGLAKIAQAVSFFVENFDENRRRLISVGAVTPNFMRQQ